MAIAALNGDRDVLDRLQDLSQQLLPFAVLSELLFGARNSGRAAENEARVWDLVAGMELVAGDRSVSDAHADLTLTTRRAGSPVPENDLWIAAVCIVTGAPLASRDAHFDSIPGLTRDEWR